MNDERPAIQIHRFPDDRRIRRELPLPQRVAEHGHERRTDAAIDLAIERAAETQLDIGDREKVGGDQFSVDLMPPISVDQRQGPGAGECHHRGERVRSIAIMLIGGKGGPSVWIDRIGVIDVHGPIEISHSHRPEQQRIQCAEDRRVDANAEREREHRHRDKARRIRQLAQAVADVLQPRFHRHSWVLRLPSHTRDGDTS